MEEIAKAIQLAELSGYIFQGVFAVVINESVKTNQPIAKSLIHRVIEANVLCITVHAARPLPTEPGATRG